MKIERINDKQIRCILTKEDLEDRKIHLSELVYGSGKARSLFRDMLKKASSEVGFDCDNTPLLIEAVPTAKEQLILIITRVDNPEEIDTRFSRFTQAGNGGGFQSLAQTLSGADDILNFLRQISRSGEKPDSEGGSTSKNAENIRTDRQTAGISASNTAAVRQLTEEEIYQYTRFYLFRNLENVILAARNIGGGYQGESSLFKNPDDGAYYLLVRKMDTNPEVFNRICNVLSEYSMPMDYATGMDEFFREHMHTIIRDHALRDLRTV